MGKNGQDMQHACERRGMLQSFYREIWSEEILRDTYMQIGDGIKRMGGETLTVFMCLSGRFSACYYHSFLNVFLLYLTMP